MGSMAGDALPRLILESRFSATLGEEPEVELALAKRLDAHELLKLARLSAF